MDPRGRDSDGLVDLVAGAPLASNTAQIQSGRALAVFGSTTFSAPGAPDAYDAEELVQTDSAIWFDGISQWEATGTAAAVADLDGDGIDDVVLSAPTSSAGGLPDTGAVYLVYGSASLGSPGGADVFDLATLDGSNGLTLVGEQSPHGFAVAVSTGDADGDGMHDLLIGSPNTPTAGEAKLLFGDGDADDDGVRDGFDNCSEIENPAQRDTNGDLFGNRCDADLNDDGIVNAADLALMRLAFFTSGDVDEDLNGDGIVNFADLSIMKDLYFLPPGPSGLTP